MVDKSQIDVEQVEVADRSTVDEATEADNGFPVGFRRPLVTVPLDLAALFALLQQMRETPEVVMWTIGTYDDTKMMFVDCKVTATGLRDCDSPLVTFEEPNGTGVTAVAGKGSVDSGLTFSVAEKKRLKLKCGRREVSSYLVPPKP